MGKEEQQTETCELAHTFRLGNRPCWQREQGDAPIMATINLPGGTGHTYTRAGATLHGDTVNDGGPSGIPYDNQTGAALVVTGNLGANVVINDGLSPANGGNGWYSAITSSSVELQGTAQASDTINIYHGSLQLDTPISFVSEPAEKINVDWAYASAAPGVQGPPSSDILSFNDTYIAMGAVWENGGLHILTGYHKPDMIINMTPPPLGTDVVMVQSATPGPPGPGISGPIHYTISMGDAGPAMLPGSISHITFA